MPRHLELPPTAKEFYALVAQAIVSNPFSDERAAIDTRIGGKRGDVGAVVRTVNARIRGLEAAGKADLRRYGGESRDILSYALLFDVYYSLTADFDNLIEAQMAAGEESCPVPFAARAIGLLERRGFDRDAARRHLALFFQIRRAFFFIDRALAGGSSSMKEVRRSLWNNIFTRDIRSYDTYLRERMEDFSTLLLGETGTGKGSAAAAIGRSGFIPFEEKSQRFAASFTRAFVAINLSEFPPSLIESELFGHRKGAFTGAVDAHAGVLSRCSPHGAIFLDEIGEVGVPMQIKLLKVLEERTFTPVGSHQQERFGGRIIAATSRDLNDLQRRGAFREDFFYRLCSDIVVLPTLRRRLDEDRHELAALVEKTVSRLLGAEAPDLAASITESIHRCLGNRYAWPGNVRELEQCVRRILLKGSYEGARQTGLRDVEAESFSRLLAADSLDARELLAEYCAHLVRRHGSLEKAAKVAKLDWRTVRKHVEACRRERPRRAIEA